MYSLSALFSLALIASADSVAVGVKRATSCACGYVTSTGDVWREALVQDMTAPGYVGIHDDPNYIISSWNQPGDGPLNMTNQPSYVYMTSDPYLQFAVNPPVGNNINRSEIQTARSDILYGSFRTVAQIQGDTGVCFGHFIYGDDTDEVDVEVLTKQGGNIINYTNQPGGTSGATVAKSVSPASTTAFHEHRFDWVAGKTRFYLDGTLESTITVNVPKIATTYIMNLWGDGGSWSGTTPPSYTTIANVKSISLYFNSTSLTAAQFNKNCAAAKVAKCSV